MDRDLINFLKSHGYTYQIHKSKLIHHFRYRKEGWHVAFILIVGLFSATLLIPLYWYISLSIFVVIVSYALWHHKNSKTGHINIWMDLEKEQVVVGVKNDFQKGYKLSDINDLTVLDTQFGFMESIRMPGHYDFMRTINLELTNQKMVTIFRFMGREISTTTDGSDGREIEEFTYRLMRWLKSEVFHDTYYN